MKQAAVDDQGSTMELSSRATRSSLCVKHCGICHQEIEPLAVSRCAAAHVRSQGVGLRSSEAYFVARRHAPPTEDVEARSAVARGATDSERAEHRGVAGARRDGAAADGHLCNSEKQ